MQKVLFIGLAALAFLGFTPQGQKFIHSFFAKESTSVATPNAVVNVPPAFAYTSVQTGFYANAQSAQALSVIASGQRISILEWSASSPRIHAHYNGMSGWVDRNALTHLTDGNNQPLAY